MCHNITLDSSTSVTVKDKEVLLCAWSAGLFYEGFDSSMNFQNENTCF